MAAETISRLPSENRKKIKPRELVIFEVDIALRELKPDDKKELLTVINGLARDHEVVIYTEEKERIAKEVSPYDLLSIVRKAPDSFEGYASRSQASKHFFDPVLRGRDPREAILFANKTGYIWKARELGMLSTYMLFSGGEAPGSADYTVANIRDIEKFRGRKL